ncbi:MAG: hypothetical protein K8R86_04130 [Bacteroidales bacterium]|nr:hypothetical protein [Bacteroidales bacterium]
MNKKSNKIVNRKQTVFKTPNVSKMQEVIIDGRTRIYIDIDADPEQARKRYLARLAAR